MKQFLKLPLLTAIVLALTGCGGSSSDESSSGNQGLGDGGASDLQTISLKARNYSFRCSDVPYQADIVFHAENGSPIGFAKTNEEGVFSDTVPKGTKHISILGETVEDAEKYTFISSELDIEGRSNLGTFSFFDSSLNCSCEDYQLDTSQLGSISYDYTLGLDNGTTLGDTYSVCPEDNKLYIQAKSKYGYDAKAAIIEIPKNSNTIEIKESDFIHQGVEVLADYNPYIDYTSTRGYFLEEHQYHLIDFSFLSNSEYLYVFPSATEHNFHVQVNSESQSIESGTMRTTSYARSRVDNDGSFELTALPEISNEIGDSLLNFVSSSDLNYDFSSADSRFARVYWSFSFLVDDAAATRFDWQISGGIRGEIPDLSFGSVFAEPVADVTAERVNILLYGYAGNNTDKQTYEQLLETIAEGGHLANPKFSNYVYLSIDAAINR